MMRAADVLLLLLLLAGPARAQSVPGVSAPGVSSIMPPTTTFFRAF